MLSKKNIKLAIHADFSPYSDEINERSHFPLKNPKINPLMVKSLLESIFKRFRKSAIQENFNLKRDPQMRKSHSN